MCCLTSCQTSCSNSDTYLFLVGESHSMLLLFLWFSAVIAKKMYLIANEIFWTGSHSAWIEQFFSFPDHVLISWYVMKCKLCKIFNSFHSIPHILWPSASTRHQIQCCCAVWLHVMLVNVDCSKCRLFTGELLLLLSNAAVSHSNGFNIAVLLAKLESLSLMMIDASTACVQNLLRSGCHQRMCL